MTGADGTVDIHLNKFLDCIPAVINGVLYSNYIGSPPHFTATPESNAAVFVTSIVNVNVLQSPPGQVFLPQALDVVIRVNAWNHDGTAAPNTEFNWIAVVRGASVTNF
jgi:hypothetical protein